MAFRVLGLDPTPFLPLYGLPEAALAAQGAMRVMADESPGYPDRVTLREAPAGASLLLLNFTHQPAASPYRSSHAIYVLEGATAQADQLEVVPEVMERRLLSVRAFDRADLIVDADVIEGTQAAGLFRRLPEDPRAAYLHVHYARRGCYAGRVERA